MKLPASIFAGWLTLSVVAFADQPAISHNDSFSKEGLLKADVAKLKDTQLVAVLKVPLDYSQNILWCGTLQLAWNEAIDLVGERLQFKDQPPVADLLNQENFTASDLDPTSYVAIADFERNHVEDKIRVALEKTFRGSVSPELIPKKPLHPGPYDFVAYAYLYKNLSFLQPFESLKEPLVFGETKVQSFGFKSKDFDIPAGTLRQVTIHDYKNPDNFIIKLQSKSPEDELILAKVPPSSTLEDTVKRVIDRLIPSEPEKVNRDLDRMSIPKLNFDLVQNFSELEGLTLKPSPSSKIKEPLLLVEVKQQVRFQLDQNGAIVKSEAKLVFSPGAAPRPPPDQPHIMIFDKPFLILMKRADSDKPYFALWVGNASLLVPTGKP